MSSPGPTWMAMLAVFVGSGAGGLARYGVALAGSRWGSGIAAPWGTILATWSVNFVGSALLAMMVARSHRGPWASEPVRLLLTTGAMGGFTTYSTFNTEVIALWSQGRGVEAAGYLAATVAGCLVGGWLGWIWAATAPD